MMSLSMTEAASPSSSWSALPNLRAFSLTEGLRLSLIVGSLSFIILAGQFAQSHNQELSAASTRQIVNAIQTVAVQPVSPTHHRMTASERYTLSQIQTFSELLDGLTERAEIVLTTTRVSEADSARLKSALQKLDENLMSAREAFARFQRSADRFDEENMRESLMAVQDSASRAQGDLMTLDQRDQGFKVSRIGQ